MKNIGNGTAEDVSIIFTYYDNSGNAIGNDNTRIYAQYITIQVKNLHSLVGEKYQKHLIWHIMIYHCLGIIQMELKNISKMLMLPKILRKKSQLLKKQVKRKAVRKRELIPSFLIQMEYEIEQLNEEDEDELMRRMKMMMTIKRRTRIKRMRMMKMTDKSMILYHTLKMNFIQLN